MCYSCAQAGVDQVWKVIVYLITLSKYVILSLFIKSLAGYNLIGLGLQVKFKNWRGKFVHKCTNSWFRTNGMRCVVGVHNLGSTRFGRQFQIYYLTFVQKVFDGLQLN